MPDYDSFRQGGVTYPLATGLSPGLLQTVDPALSTALAFFSGVLALHLQPRLNPEAVAVNAPLRVAVQKAVPYDPGPTMVDPGLAFPLLAVYRVTEQFTMRTVAKRHRLGTWGIKYVLPVLAEAPAERFYGTLKAAADIIDARVLQGWDPGYQNGARIWQAAGIEEIELTSGAYARFDSRLPQQVHLGWTGVLMVKEMLSEGVTSQAFAGADASIAVGNFDTVDVKT